MRGLAVCLLLVLVVAAQAAPFLEDLPEFEPMEEEFEVAKRRGPFLATCRKKGTRQQCFCYFDSDGTILNMMKCN